MPPDDDEGSALATALRRVAADAADQRTQTAELAQTVESLIDILVRAQTLKPGHVAMLKRVAANAEAVRTPPIELSSVVDKYAERGDDFECAPRLHLCQARCCSFAVKLSRQDLEEGKVRWEIDHPYRLPRDKADGYCTYLSRTDDERLGGCTNYEVRPATCRSYTCRDDARVWLDFDAMIPAPMPDHVVPIAALTRRR